MNKLFFIFIISLSYLSLESQIIDNKIDLSLGYGAGKFGGNEMINKDGFIAPSLYANFNNLYGISLKGIFFKKEYFSLGATVSYSSAGGWDSDTYTDYINSGVLQYSFSPLAQIHNKLQETGFFNRVSFILEIAPAIGLSKLSLSNPLFDIQNESSQIAQPTGSNDLYYGLKGATGMKTTLNQDIGAFIELSYGYYQVSSKLYSDSHFSNYGIEAGVIIRLIKNKRYFY